MRLNQKVFLSHFRSCPSDAISCDSIPVHGNSILNTSVAAYVIFRICVRSMLNVGTGNEAAKSSLVSSLSSPRESVYQRFRAIVNASLFSSINLLTLVSLFSLTSVNGTSFYQQKVVNLPRRFSSHVFKSTSVACQRSGS